MKKINPYLLFILIFPLAVISCKKEIKNVSTVVPVSYPGLTLIGDSVISLPVGNGVYKDSGAIGTDNVTGATSQLTPISNPVVLSTPGFYTVQFETKNKDGFKTDKARLVLVTAVGASVNISGPYICTTNNNQPVRVKKIGTGLYITNNVGGLDTTAAANAGLNIPAFFGQISDTSIVVPMQSTLLGSLYATNGTLTISPTDTSFSYAVVNPYFPGTPVTFSYK